MNSDNEEMSRISGILSKIPKRVTPEDRIAELEAEVARLTAEVEARTDERDGLSAALASIIAIRDEALRIAAEGGFLAGMNAAAKLKHQVRTEETPSDYEYGEGWDAGHDAHQSAIRATVGRLKKEMKANG